MAKVDFNNMQDDSAYSTANNAGNDINFFTLRNDNDEAIVRFMCDSVEDFEILTVHDIQIGGKYRKINCIRDFRDPVENCPLCASGAKINQRFFIKMIQYEKTTDPTGNVIVTPKAAVWERSTSYAKTLKSYLDNYGPLSDIICKVIRHGKAGDMQTTYEIVPNLNKNIYRDEVYVKDVNIFGGFNAFGTIVMDRTYDEIMQFQLTGQFPVREKKQEAANDSAIPNNSVPYNAPVQNAVPQSAPMNQGYAAPQFNQTAAPQFENYVPQTASAPTDNFVPTQPAQPVNNVPQGGWGQPTPRATMPWENNTQQNAGGFERPRRY
jgi:hypothetical protein